MSNLSEDRVDFETFLGDRGITATDFAILSKEKKQYLQETWLLEQHATRSEILPEAEEEEQEQEPAPYEPALSQPEARGDQTVLWAVLGCVAVLVVSLFITNRLRSAGTAAAPAGQSAPAATGVRDVVQDTTSSTGTSTVTSPLASVPAMDWREVGRANGTGIKRVAPFTITGPKWKIIWATRPGSGQKASDFVIGYRRRSGEPPVPAAHVRGESEGEAVLRGTGSFTVESNSNQNYYLKVYDYR